MSDEFTILSATNEAVKPVKTRAGSALVPRLPRADHYVAAGDYGVMNFQQLCLRGLTLWFSHYDMQRPTVIRSRIEQPILEGHITLQNRMAHSLGKTDNLLLHSGEFNVTYIPFCENKAYFHKNGHYSSFDIHPSLPLLQRYTPDFPRLDVFLERIDRGCQEPVSLLENRSLLTLDMQLLINKIIQHEVQAEAAAVYTEVLCHELLLLFLLRTYAGPARLLKSYNKHIDRLLHVKELLETQANDIDFEGTYLTEWELAEEAGLTLFQLKKGFKMAFGMGPYEMLIELRMDIARRLLLDSRLDILDIALKIGYQSSESFIKAFKKRNGVTPTQYRKG